jgi:hypothetical protein
MKKLFIFAVVLGAVYAVLAPRRTTERLPTHRPDLDQWEGEGGAVPRERPANGCSNRRRSLKV